MPRTKSKVTAISQLDPEHPKSSVDQGSHSAYSYNNGCNCSKCMRKQGPVQDDRSERTEAISGILYQAFESVDEDYHYDTEEEYDEECDETADRFMCAVELNDVNDLEMCFEDVKGLQGSDYCGRVASHLIVYAAQLGGVDVIRALAKYGKACVNAIDEHKGGTALMYACHNGHTAAVKALVEPPLSAELDIVDNNGYTALMICTFCDRVAPAEILVKAGAAVDKACYDHNRTALSYAAYYGSLDCLQVLGSAGADPFHEDNEGYSVLDLADKRGRPGCVEAVKRMQQKARMQKKLKERREGDSKGSQGGGLLNEAERRRAEAEAEARAAQLLAEIELEDTKGAKASQQHQQHGSQQQQHSKKDKSKVQDHQPGPASLHPSTSKPAKGAAKTNGASHEDAPTTSSQPPRHPRQPKGGAATASAAAASPLDHVPAGPSPASTSGKQAPPAAQVLAPTANGSPPSSSTPYSPTQAAVRRGARANSARPLPPPAAATVSTTKATVTTTADAAANADTPTAAADAQLLQAAVQGEAPPSDQETLRRQWEAVLQEACRCRDEREQPVLLATVQRLLPVCNEAGISVKYGRKVLQRLEVVAPARAALQSALAPPRRSAQLEAALRGAKPAASLLDPQLLVHAEAALGECKAEEERSKWDMLASQLRQQGNMLLPPQLLPALPPAAPAPAPGTALTLLPPQPSEQGAGAGAAAHAGCEPGLWPEAGVAMQTVVPYIVSHPTVAAVPGHQVPAPNPPPEGPSEEEIECVVCFEAERAVICVPCMHICLCAKCAAGIRQGAKPECPVCCTPLEDVFEIAC